MALQRAPQGSMSITMMGVRAQLRVGELTHELGGWRSGCHRGARSRMHAPRAVRATALCALVAIASTRLERSGVEICRATTAPCARMFVSPACCYYATIRVILRVVDNHSRALGAGRAMLTACSPRQSQEVSLARPIASAQSCVITRGGRSYIII